MHEPGGSLDKANSNESLTQDFLECRLGNFTTEIVHTELKRHRNENNFVRDFKK
jgi:hypothetical protein